MSWQQLADNVAKKVVNTFRTTATYSPKTGPAYSLDCVFDSAYIEASVLDGASVQSVFPRAFVRLGDLLARPVAGDRMTVNAVIYRVAECRPDGEAGYLLILEKM